MGEALCYQIRSFIITNNTRCLKGPNLLFCNFFRSLWYYLATLFYFHFFFRVTIVVVVVVLMLAVVVVIVVQQL